MTSKIIKWFDERVDSFGVQYLAFGCFGLINFPFSYFMWTEVVRQTYDNLILRIIATLACLLLLLKNYWPAWCKPYFNLYWIATLIYTASFFATFMLLKNDFSLTWQMNYVQVLLILVLLVSWEMFFFCLLVGVLLGLLAFFISMHFNHMSYSLLDSEWRVTLYMFIYAVVIGGVFSRNKQKIEAAKNNAAYTVSANIAHELRTPLASINAAVSSVHRYFLILLQAYELAQTNHLAIEKIPVNKLKLLPNVLNNIQEEVRYSNLFIDMLLLNIQNLEVKEGDLEIRSISELIHHAFLRFPFEENQEELIHFDEHNDFKVRVVPLFFEHIIFNLTKNALYYIKDAGKGEVNIWYESGKDYNYLHFKDTGKGMDKKTLSHLFERFYTSRYQGTGVGLAFCKQMMEQFEGDITCESVQGEYTHFILQFPVVK